MLGTDLITDPGILVAAALLAVGAVGAGLADRLRVPGLLLFLGAGMLAGDEGLGIVSLRDPMLAQTVGVVALAVILFHGGLTTMPSDLRRAAGPGFLLATVGVVVTAGTVAAGVLVLLRTDLLTAALIGAVVASTDAAAVFSVVRKAPLPRRLMSLLEVESGTNDPVAIMLTIGVLETWRADPTALELIGFGVAQLGGGLLLGVAVGWAGSAAMRTLPLGSSSLYPVFGLALAGLSFGTAMALAASGFLAVYATGFTLSIRVPRHRRSLRVFHEGVANAAEIGLFLVLGLLLVPSRLLEVALPALAVTGVLVFMARPLAVGLCLLPFRFGWRDHTLMAWAGLRGAVPIVLATFPLTAGYPEGAVVFDIVFFVVLVSSAVQAGTVGVVADWLGLRAGSRVWAPIAEALPLDGIDADVIEVEITEDLAVADRPLRTVPLPPGALLTVVMRGASTLVPTGDTVLRPGDLVLVTVPRRPTATAELVRWAKGEPADGHEESR